ncbi:hypothetical protein QJS10_CPA06g02583 [Acorus calamus]|uniref:Uncharacterized protein n=1 Tax=Acorus calamus TaxID=4465 RepID=A0AAV9EQL3_ACOCL|nr:hypothetical protein QJS10_CPA06g02583 [Acorus calamus]
MGRGVSPLIEWGEGLKDRRSNTARAIFDLESTYRSLLIHIISARIVTIWYLMLERKRNAKGGRRGAMEKVPREVQRSGAVAEERNMKVTDCGYWVSMKGDEMGL